MQKSLALTLLLLFAFSVNASAQVFNQPRPSAVKKAVTVSETAVKTEPKPVTVAVPEVTEADMEAIANIPPATITPEQKVEAQAGVLKNNKYLARKKPANEIDGMISALNRFDGFKAQTDRLSGKQNSFQPVKVNPKNPQAVEKFLNQRLQQAEAIAFPAEDSK